MTSSLELYPPQAKLVEQLLAHGPVRLAVSAPPGAGKTRAVLVAIERLTARDPSSTVLVVAPSALATYVSAVLKNAPGDLGVHRLKGAELRLREGAPPQLDHGVHFVSIELARQPWARNVLASMRWSLVFVDEATFLEQRVNEFVVRLSASSETERLCVVFDGVRSRIPQGLDLVTWDLGELQRLPRRTEVISYRLTPEEISVHDRLQETAREFVADPVLRPTLESAWRSSLSAFQFVLAKLLGLLDSPHDPTGSSDSVVLGRTGQSDAGKRSLWRDPDGAATALRQLATQVTEIGHDSKLEAFLAWAAGRQNETQIAVFTAMRQSALYLQAGLESQGSAASVIDGSRALDDRPPADLARIVIITDAVLPAVDLPSGFEGVSYDLPFDPRRMETRWSILRNGTEEAVMAVMIDETGTDALEQELAHRHALIDEALGGDAVLS